MSKNLLRSTLLVGQMTLVSRVLGLVRDSVIAAVFGASHATDAFFVAFKIPNLFRRLFAEGAFSQAFVPVLGAYKAERSETETRELVGAVTGVLTAILCAVTVFGVVAAPLVIMVVAPGFVNDAARFALTVELLRLTFPYLFFIALTALFAGVLNTYRRFAVPALTPALLNVALIGAALLVAPRLAEPVLALAMGVLAGGVLQLALQVGAAWRAGVLSRPRVAWRHPGVQRIMALMLPGIFGVSVAQLNFLVDTLIASYLREGSISWLYFSDRLMEFPLGIFGIALGTVILPSLSEYHARGDHRMFSETLDWALRIVLLITVPSAVGLAVLAGPILSTLFQYGRMSEFDVIMSARSLVTYAFGLSGFILVKVLAPGFFSRQDVRTPVRIGVIALVSNLVLNLVLVWPLQHAGLALATSLAAFVNAGLLFRLLRRNGAYVPGSGWRTYLFRIAFAVTAMAAVLWVLKDPQSQWSDWGVAMRGTRLTLLVVAGVATYVVACWVAGIRPRHVAQPKPAL
ncbi:MAG: murein biosynthesis integral membrane protein MurJ [Gammaproteobacteria bacterium]